MDQIETKKITYEQKIHHYFCDDCGTDLGTCAEYEDGYAPEPERFYIGHTPLEGNYCKKCATKRIDEVVAFAKSKGFDFKYI